MNSALEVFKETPWWVYLLLCYLIILGIKARRPRRLHFKKLYILPVLLAAWTLYSLYVNFGLLPKIWIWFVGLVIGSLFSGFFAWRSHIFIDKQRKWIGLGGNKATLWLLLFIFIVKYFFSYISASRDTLLYNQGFIDADFLISGFFTGLLLGRSLVYTYKYYKKMPAGF